MIEAEPLYRDSLITIRDDGILFKNYGLLGRDRFVALGDIEKVIIKKPTFWNGKWKFHGSGLRTWFPGDDSRPKRDAIFLAYIRKKWWRVGFTVEDSLRVADVFKEKGLIDNSADTVLAETAELRDQSMLNPGESYKRDERSMLSLGLIMALIPLIAFAIAMLCFLVFNCEPNRG